MMADWPEDDGTLDFEFDLMAPCIEALRAGGGVWNGPSLPDALKANCLPFPMVFSAEILEEGDRDLDETAIMVALQLGIEQGRRIEVAAAKQRAWMEDLERRAAALTVVSA